MIPEKIMIEVENKHNCIDLLRGIIAIEDWATVNRIPLNIQETQHITIHPKNGQTIKHSYMLFQLQVKDDKQFFLSCYNI